MGTPMLYAASTIALTCLETIVHLDGMVPLPLNRYLVRIDVPETMWRAAVAVNASAHVGWDALPSGIVSIGWGTRWCDDMTTVLARVPSVVVPEEFNVLINPRHSDMHRVKATKIRKWNYDQRSFGKSL
jgi:RES domain-containing protein